MGMVFLCLSNELTINGVFFFELCSYNNGFVHFVTNNDTRSCFSYISCTQSLDELTKTVYITTVWKGSFPSAPQNPETGWAYYNTIDKKSYIYDGEKWNVMSQDGIDGQNGIDGKSIVWKGSFQSSDVIELRSPQINWAYYNITDKKAYIFDGAKWCILAQDGKDGANGKNTIEINGIVETEGNVPSVISFPKLIQNETETMVSFVAGRFEFENDSDNDLPQQTVFSFALENDTSKKIKIVFDSENTYLELQIVNGGRTVNTRRSNENLLDLYDQSIDGEKYIFESASVTFGKGWELKGVLNFTPSVCPNEVQMPRRKTGISLVETEDGIQITLNNIPSDASSIYIRQIVDNYWSQIFNISRNSNYSFPSSIQVYDCYVENGKDYQYCADIYYGNSWDDYIRTDYAYITPSNGLGKLDFDASVSTEGVILSFEVPDSLDISNIWYSRGFNTGKFQDISTRNKVNNELIVTDYFVPLNTTITYSCNVNVNLNFENGIYASYRPRTDEKTVTTPVSNCGYGEVYISNSPAASWDGSKITFTTEPQLSIADFPSGVSVNSIGFIYRNVNDDSRNYYLYYGDMRPNWEKGSYYPSELCSNGDRGYYIGLRDNQGNSWGVYREPEQLFEGMPQTIVIE